MNIQYSESSLAPTCSLFKNTNDLEVKQSIKNPCLAQNNTKNKPIKNEALQSNQSSTVSQSYLLAIRKATNYSIRQIAIKSGIPYSTIQRLCAGVTKNPTTKNFCNLLRLYCQVELCLRQNRPLSLDNN